MSVISEQAGFQIRPRFEVASEKKMEEIFDLFKAALQSENSQLLGKLRLGYIGLFPNEKFHHYWSPHLSITIEEVEGEDKRLLYGHYGPSPSVWLMFIFFYSVIGLLIVIVSVIGFANMSIGDSGAVLWLVPLLILGFCSFYLVSYFGQKKGEDQMKMIHTFVETCLGEKIN